MNLDQRFDFFNRLYVLSQLTIEDMCGLYYRTEYGPPPRDSGPRSPRLVEYKIYFKSDCERRAWEVHGGPTGLALAQRSRG